MAGGPSLYSARAALALGARVQLLSAIPPDYPEATLAGIEVERIPADDAPRYVNSYDAEGNRVQQLLSTGTPIPPDAPLPRDCDVLIVAPAFHEIPALPAVRATVTAVSLQGALRDRRGLDVVPRKDAWAAVEPFARPGTLCFMSEEDTADPETLAGRIAAEGALAFVTRGYRGVSVFDCAGVRRFPAYPARPADPTGAGDAFATAFALRFFETGDRQQALEFASMAGALAVEGSGIDALPSRAAIEARLAGVPA